MADKTIPCPSCSGRPQIPPNACWRCGGSGRIMATAPDAPKDENSDELTAREKIETAKQGIRL